MPRPYSIALLALACLTGCRSADIRTNAEETRPSRSFRLFYRAAVNDVPEGAQTVRLWIPVPQSSADQTITNVRVMGTSGNQAFELTPERFDEPRGDVQAGDVKLSLRPFMRGEGRSVCVETPGDPLELELRFDVLRYETEGSGPNGDEDLSELLGPDAMIPLDGKVHAMAASLSTSADPGDAARELYDHTLERMRYDKPPGGLWGRGDAEWACDSRHGNCTDFHSYFLGLARSKQIPARFVMGFPVPGGEEELATIGGYHCWAYFWTEADGWIPVDISEADKHPELAERYFGWLDHDRVVMTGGRDLLLDPAPAGGPLNFFVYPYAEVDGTRWDDTSRSFSRQNLD